MPNGDQHTPLTDDERADFFYSQLGEGELASDPPPMIELLARSSQTMTREFLEDFFGVWATLLLDLLEWGDDTPAILRNQSILRERLIGRGMPEELADYVLAGSGHSIVDLMTEHEIWSSAWPTLEELRVRAHRRGWHRELIRERLGDPES
jgi:hypothetical protein